MLRIQFSNRIESLRDSLVDAIGQTPASPFSPQQIIVPSLAMKRHLTMGIAEKQGICANVNCVYLAEWLWRQIAHVVRTVTVDSPFASSVLAWRIYQTLEESAWAEFPRLSHYLQDPNPVMRFELAAEVAALFEQYITYRQDWLSAWLQGESVRMPGASDSQAEDQAWQAELWRRISIQLGTAPEHPTAPFFRRLETAGTNPCDLPEAVHVFCLPAIPPLYFAVLTGLARWIDVTLYVLNPCREYWFDIVEPKRLRALAVRGTVGHHDTGNRLLASWGAQTKAYIEMLLDRSGDAPLDDEGFDDQFPSTILGELQRAIFTLTELEPASLAALTMDRSIEVHVCHSLTRQLEVLQDQLLAVFAGPSPPKPQEILIVMPDLESSAPLIDAVFGNVPEDRRLPYSITGRGRSTANAAARALLSVLAILPSRFPASALVELLQQPLIGRRFRIGVEELSVIESWLNDGGIRWGLDAEHRRELGTPATERFTIADGLDRLFLGYALPQQASAPTFGRIPAGDAEGSKAEILGSFAEFVEQLAALRTDLRVSRPPEAWFARLLEVVESFLVLGDDDIEDLGEVRESLRALHDNMRRGGLERPVPLAVIRASLEAQFDTGAHGGAPTGAITFSSMSSLRNLPYRFIGILEMNDGAFPASSRPREFDLMAAAPRVGDRQRRLDDRNLFLDLVLAARERLYLSYTGRSIRDNGVLPPSVLVAELVDALLPALSKGSGDLPALKAARAHLIVEHPLQAFAELYFNDQDPRTRSFNRELCDALRHKLEASAMAATDGDARDDAGPAGDDSDDGRDASGARAERFFAASLVAPGPEWRRVSFEQLLKFFRNPCAFLLKDRLGLSLFREAGAVADEEPFIPDYRPRQALAERLLPQAMGGLGAHELSRLARAGIEYPPGAFGAAAIDDEMRSLQSFAREVRAATEMPRFAPLAVDLPFSLEGEDWQLATVVTERRGAGLVLHRYDDTAPTDFLNAWLNHLVASAASGVPLETRWISRNGSFRLTPCHDATRILERLLLLYRRGLREPVHFFPKSAWEYIKTNRDLGKARARWQPRFGDLPGEEKHEAYRLALRGIADPLDEDFKDCAEIVFGSTEPYLDDPRP